ncbi:hypothetical protein E5K00_15870 [Hymenobacter aquaticus]|uniref:Uncharacterized protein n=1 Tax=Hymenobacter aquaticus TaxID=1867101 RepID=A0A4Z0PWT4_9BACT|nr:hypothetical protein [Hymenobacter aquaticus]TGE21746.1 hypothetical protein E5K00_15870 [Hymenobacter aquaticus]
MSSYSLLRVLVSAFCLLGGTIRAHGQASLPGRPPQALLRASLQRAITMTGVCGNSYDEDQRVRDIQDLDSIQARFIGRATGWWNTTYDTREDSLHFARTYYNTHRIQAADSLAIVQGAVFEYIRDRGATTSNADRIRIPGWVLQAWGQKADTVRYFVSANIAYAPGDTLDPIVHDTAQPFEVPDVTRLEARMWLYYRACSYLAADIEALHMGQMRLIANKDRYNDYAATRELFDQIRRFAQYGAPGFVQPNGRQGARRQWVALDCHSKRLLKSQGQDLFDFYSIPIRAVKLYTNANTKGFYASGVYGTELLVNTCQEENGGVFQAHESPGLFLVEFDNSRSLSVAPDIGTQHTMWGWDEISWFGQQPAAYRADWLRYAHNWLACNDTDVFLQMPGLREQSIVDRSNREVKTLYRFSDTRLEKRRIREIWDGVYDNWVPAYAVPGAATAGSVAIETDGVIYWVDSTSHAIVGARWDATARVPAWAPFRVGEVANAAGDLRFEVAGTLFYRTLDNHIEYYEYEADAQRWVHYTTNGPADVGGNLTFAGAGPFLNRRTYPTIFYRSLTGRLEYLQYVDSTASWTHQAVRRVRVDNTAGAIVCPTPGLVACISGSDIKVFRRNGPRWQNVSPWDGKNDVRSDLNWSNFAEDTEPNGTIGRFYYCSFTNDIGTTRYDYASGKWDDGGFSYVGVRNAAGDITFKDASEMLYRTTDKRIGSIRWGCPQGPAGRPGWIQSEYVGVQDCYRGLVRQRDNSLFYIGAQNTVRYLTWEGLKCTPPANALGLRQLSGDAAESKLGSAE